MAITPTHSPLIGRKPSLVKIGGSLGIAATGIALAIFIVGICNFDAVFIISPLPFALAAIGFVLTIVGGIARKYDGEEETEPMSAMFTTIAGLIGGAIEIYIWMHLPK